MASLLQNDVTMSPSEIPFNVTMTSADMYGDFFSGGMSLHPHWQGYVEDFQTIPDFVFYGLGIYIAVVGIIGVLGNFLVIWIFATAKPLRTPSNMFIINLAISDMGFSAVNGFPLMTIAAFQKRWMWGELACELYGLLGGVFGFNSINTLAWISIDRYYVISKPFHAMKNVSHRRAMYQIIVVWIWSVLWACPPLIGWGKYIPEGFQIECSFDYLSRDWGTLIHNHGMFWMGFVAPVLIIAFCYINIFLTVGRQGKDLQKTAAKMGAKTSADDRKKKQEIQTAKIAAATIGLFLVSWIPYAMVAQLGVWNRLEFVTPYTTQIPVMFAKASAMWNPILYALSHPKFRAQLDSRFPWLVCCSGSNMDKGEESSVSNTARPKETKPRLTREMSAASGITEVSDMDVEEERKERPIQKLRRSILKLTKQQNIGSTEIHTEDADSESVAEMGDRPSTMATQHVADSTSSSCKTDGGQNQISEDMKNANTQEKSPSVVNCDGVRNESGLTSDHDENNEPVGGQAKSRRSAKMRLGKHRRSYNRSISYDNVSYTVDEGDEKTIDTSEVEIPESGNDESFANDVDPKCSIQNGDVVDPNPSIEKEDKGSLNNGGIVVTRIGFMNPAFSEDTDSEICKKEENHAVVQVSDDSSLKHDNEPTSNSKVENFNAKDIELKRKIITKQGSEYFDGFV